MGSSSSTIEGARHAGRARRYRRGMSALGDAAFAVLMLLTVLGVIVVLVVGGSGKSPGSLVYMAVVAVIFGSIFGLSAIASVTVWPDRPFLEVRNGLRLVRVDWSDVAGFELAPVQGVYRRRKTGVVLQLKHGRGILCKALSGSRETAHRFLSELNSELAARQSEASDTGAGST